MTSLVGSGRDKGQPKLLPALTLPRGGGAIRGTGEKFSANPATGAVSLSIPLAATPGRAGFQVTLLYNSGAGNGPFGIGCRLDLPWIARRTEKRLPQYDNEDVFVFAGAEDLVPCLVTNPDGTLGPDTYVEGTFRVRVFRLRVEGAFARIECWTHRTTGDIHWQSVSRDNVRSIYGRSQGARIVDPNDAFRVYAWLLEETRDDRGNVAAYEYKPEDGAGVDFRRPSESHRRGAGFAQRYLKSILYGNRKPGEAGGWLFELVLDYGDHDTLRPTPDRVWPVRADPWSDGRPGFEVRTYRLCRRILIFHHIPELGDDPCLVASTDFTYDETASITCLREVVRAGYERKADGTYEHKAEGPIKLGFTQPELQDMVQVLADGDLPGVHGPNVLWEDLDGEGIPGVLIADRDALWYRKNRGGGELGGPERLPSQPAPCDLATGLQQLVDLEGTGQKCVVEYAGPLAGYFERTIEEDWEPFVPFDALPTVDWSSLSLRFLDLTGDGRPDLLISEQEAFVWYRSKGKAGFDDAEVVPKPNSEREGPDIVLSDREESIFLADMTGDGLVDIVRVRNDEIVYWPNLGYGRFGPKVRMDRAPHLDAPDQFSARKVLLGDIDGTGTADLIYAGRNGIEVYFNQAGNGFSAAWRMTSLPLVDSSVTLSVVDLHGTGTACIVWASPSRSWGTEPVMYLNPLGGVKPYLLNRVRSSFGAETCITYASSTKFYLKDQAAGRPWATRLHFPVHVVERVEQSDAVTGTRLVSRYRYHHGYFDPHEREFGGFALVEQWDTESLGSAGEDLPPVRRMLWFHTGAPVLSQRCIATQFYSLDIPHVPLAKLPKGLSLADEREASRALRGRPMREEIYAEDKTADSAHPYAVTAWSYGFRRIQPGRGESPAVFLAYEEQRIDLHLERRPSDPRIEHALTLDVDGWGNVTRSASVAYGRRSAPYPEQERTLVTVAETDVANPGATGTGYRVGVPFASRAWDVTGVLPPAGKLFTPDSLRDAFAGATSLSYDATASGTAPEKRLIAREKRIYTSDDLSGPLLLGEIGTRALLYQSYTMALTQSMVADLYGTRVTVATLGDEARYVLRDGALWAPSDRPTYDAAKFYLPTSATDPFGQERSVTYDAYALLAIEVHGPLGEITRAVPDYRVLQPWMTIDENGNRVAVAFDALGRVEKTAVMGKEGDGEGDTLDDPTTRIEYHLSRFHDEGKPCFVRTLARERHGADNPRWQESVTYFDGLGREVMKKVQAEPGLAPERDGAGVLVRDAEGKLVPAQTDSRWVGTGRTVFNNKGLPVKKYEPFFSSTHEYEDEGDLVAWGVTPILWYDPLGRHVRTDNPNGTCSRVIIEAWRETSWDENDTVVESAWLAARQALLAGDSERRAALLAAAHAGTPTVVCFDPLRRPFLTIADNGPAGQYLTRVALDIEGNQRRIVDARGVETVQRFDMMGRRIHVESPDAGERLTLLDVAGKPVRAWDARGIGIRTVYDARQRATHIYVQLPNLPAERLAVRRVYGEAHPEAALRNLRGRLYQEYDGAGVATHGHYDFKGNLLASSRTLSQAYQQAPDWSALAGIGDVTGIETAAGPLLESEVFAEERRYDALDRLVSLTKPDGSELRPTYNEANLLERMDVRVRGAANWTTFVTSIDYNAKGQRESIAYGSGVETAYEYDPLTFRMTRVQTTRAGDGARLQDLRYTFDPVGNVVEVRDGAQQSELFGSPPVAGGGRYTYDALYRLIEAEGREHPGQQPTHEEPPQRGIPHPNDIEALRPYVERYEIDPGGNLVRVEHQAGAVRWTRRYEYATESNRLLRTSQPGDLEQGPLTGTYAHDANGSMTQMPHLAAMIWDHADRLASADLGGGGKVYFAYAGGGQRVRKVWDHSGLVEERIYLGGFEVYRRRVGPNVEAERETLHVIDDQRRIAMVETKTRESGVDIAAPVPRVRYQLDDHLGSALLEVNEAGLVISYEEYFPFGGTAYHAARSGVEVSARRYRYNGKERDGETGLYYYGARYYAPWLGRWTSADPAGAVDGTNHYAYCRGSPLRFTDPVGTQSAERQLIPVPERPKGLPVGVDTWAYSAGGLVVTSNQQRFEELTRGRQVFTYDPGAPKENIAQLRGAQDLSAMAEMRGALIGALAEEPKAGAKKGGSAKSWVDTFAEELTYFAAIANQQLGEDTKDPKASKEGIVGGKNVMGPKSRVLQTIAAAVMIVAGVIIQTSAFELAVRRAANAGKTLVTNLTAKIAEKIAARGGWQTTAGLAQTGVIGPYAAMREFTKGMGSRFQAHHILEKHRFDEFRLGDPDLAPSVILTDKAHSKITSDLRAATQGVTTKAELWRAYQAAYKDYPEWLNAIRHYFE